MISKSQHIHKEWGPTVRGCMPPNSMAGNPRLMGQSTDPGGEVSMVHTGGWEHPWTPAGSWLFYILPWGVTTIYLSGIYNLCTFACEKSTSIRNKLATAPLCAQHVPGTVVSSLLKPHVTILPAVPLSHTPHNSGTNLTCWVVFSLTQCQCLFWDCMTQLTVPQFTHTLSC